MDFMINQTELYSANQYYNRSNSTVFDELYDVPVGIIVLLSMFYGSISVMAVIGNSLVIWIVATTRQMHTVTNLFIANLALADVTIGMFAIPFQFQAALLQRWNLPEFMCQFCPFVQIVTVNVSVFTLTAIAVDRHRAILNPLKARPSKRVCKIIISAIWFLSLILASPIVIAFRVIQTPDGNTTKPFCVNVNLSFNQLLIYRYLLVFVQYVIPLSIISFVYIQMAVRLWGSKTPGNAQDARDINLLKNKKKVIKMLVIVVAIFGICWLPLHTYSFLQATFDAINEYRYINIVFFCCDWLAMSNSCYNPFIYGIYNEKFKREFRKRFPFCRSRFDDYNNDKNISIHTRVSSVRSSTYTNNSSTRRTVNNLTNMNNIEMNPIGGRGSYEPVSTNTNDTNGALGGWKNCNKCSTAKDSIKEILHLNQQELTPQTFTIPKQTITPPPSISDLNYNNSNNSPPPTINKYFESVAVTAIKQSPKQKTYVYRNSDQPSALTKGFNYNDASSDKDIYILLKIESNNNHKDNDNSNTNKNANTNSTHKTRINELIDL